VIALVSEQFESDFADLSLPKFFSWRNRSVVAPSDDVHFLRILPKMAGVPVFSEDAAAGVCEGHTVTYVAMQLAYYMGFSEVVLVGVDHRFATAGPPNQTVESQGDDPNHFAPNYFGRGVKWQLPDLEASELAYRVAKRAFEADGRRIVDATIDGELNVFEKVDIDYALADPQVRG
jgi:hypothetical protein